MSDSKFPNLKEIGQWTEKFLGDIKQSVGEIMDDYKRKYPNQTSTTESEQASEQSTTAPDNSNPVPDTNAEKLDTHTTEHPIEPEKINKTKSSSASKSE